MFIVLFYQLLNEAEYHLKNYGDRVAVEADNTLWDLHNSSDGTKIIVLLFIQNNFWFKN